MELTLEDVENLTTGALFVSCSVDHESCFNFHDRILSMLTSTDKVVRLVNFEDMDPDDLVVVIGFVNKGLPLTELVPVGDEFTTGISLLEQELGTRISAVVPLAAGNVNALVPILVGLQTGLPTIDSDPMGRVFPLLSQSTLNLAGISPGPFAVVGATGDSGVIRVTDSLRADHIIRAMAAEFGGWVATVSYPTSAARIQEALIHGTLSQLIQIGKILNSQMSTTDKYSSLSRQFGVRRLTRACVVDVEGLSRPFPRNQPDHPTSATLVDNVQGHIVRLEIQNEILLVMIDGAVEAVVPDIVTILRTEDAGVASLEDLWIGNEVDILTMPAAALWYTPEGLRLAGPDSHRLHGARKRRR